MVDGLRLRPREASTLTATGVEDSRTQITFSKGEDKIFIRATLEHLKHENKREIL